MVSLSEDFFQLQRRLDDLERQIQKDLYGVEMESPKGGACGIENLLAASTIHSEKYQAIENLVLKKIQWIGNELKTVAPRVEHLGFGISGEEMPEMKKYKSLKENSLTACGCLRELEKIKPLAQAIQEKYQKRISYS